MAMNGDQASFEPLFYAKGPLRLLCILFIVVSNWALLAILTAVVSENMLSATEKHETIEKEAAEVFKQESSKRRLTTLFNEIDKDEDGRINDQEFTDLVRDDGYRKELCDASDLGVRDLQDLFQYLSKHDNEGYSFVDYADFIDKLVEKREVTERSLFRLENQMRNLETRIDQKLISIQEKLHRHANIDYVLDDTGQPCEVHRGELYWRA